MFEFIIECPSESMCQIVPQFCTIINGYMQNVKWRSLLWWQRGHMLKAPSMARTFQWTCIHITSCQTMMTRRVHVEHLAHTRTFTVTHSTYYIMSIGLILSCMYSCKSLACCCINFDLWYIKYKFLQVMVYTTVHTIQFERARSMQTPVLHNTSS